MREYPVVKFTTSLLKLPPLQLQRKEGLDLSALQTGVMGGAPCPIELCRELTDELNITEMAVNSKRKNVFSGFFDVFLCRLLLA